MNISFDCYKNWDSCHISSLTRSMFSVSQQQEDNGSVDFSGYQTENICV